MALVKIFKIKASTTLSLEDLNERGHVKVLKKEYVQRLDCADCGHISAHKHLYYKHRKLVHGKGKQILACPDCDYVGQGTSHVKRHIKTVHLGIKDIMCDQCNWVTALKADLKRHKKTVHCGPGPVNAKQVCPHCGYLAPIAAALKRHISAVHYLVKDFKCDQCDYATAYKNSLKRHMESASHGKDALKSIRSEPKVVECSHCDYVGGSAHLVGRHFKAVHRQVKDFLCDQCDYATSYKHALKRHKQQATHRHPASRKIKKESDHEDGRCPQCFFVGKSQHHLRKHIKSEHPRLKEFKCDQCTYESSYENCVERHKKKAHDGELEVMTYAMPTWRGSINNGLSGNNLTSDGSTSDSLTSNISTLDSIIGSIFTPVPFGAPAVALMCGQCSFETMSDNLLASHIESCNQNPSAHFEYKEVGTYESSNENCVERHKKKAHDGELEVKMYDMPTWRVSISDGLSGNNSISNGSTSNSSPSDILTLDGIIGSILAPAPFGAPAVALMCGQCSFETMSDNLLASHMELCNQNPSAHFEYEEVV
jgi:hypothetical protein